MNLKVIGTGSQGNAYLLYNKEEVLLIECGVVIKKIKEALNYDFSKVVGCLISHEHGDHNKAIKDVLSAGIKVYASHGTLEASGVAEHHNTHPIQSKKIYQIGNFKIIPFDIRHDANEPLGFLIQHPECGVTLFLTDSFYSPYKFNGLNNLIIEANFCEDIIDQKLKFDRKFLRDRILKSHLSIQKCIDLLNVNDLTAVNNIVLIHLSDSNSNEIEFQKNVLEATGKNTIVAYNGLDILFNKNPF
ncbi:MBL fold metallo-hydrolase [Flavobacterium sp. CBA20B-1]|uniref:MBL fold metallo-hydrolase n=1 Tax=unclassified Flavobacterium TaxID=196869 RepID=UPI002225AFF8|nr:MULTISPECIES: MBL fold metallo-hydrolase [unclassified Flavobacterium]WCM42442.1 MBL fold metallo-hydrolase [Flavobacterium sp. CBA20B-1]